MAKIKIKNVFKTFEHVKVLDNISMEIEQGELVALLGSSGSGKTTLLNILTGFIESDSGDVLFNDQNMNGMPINKRSAAIVDQNILLFPHMTVYENIAFGLKVKGLPKSLIKKKVLQLVELIELRGHEKKFPAELSGGQKQRVAIARALAIEPNVLLLDEPFSKLDITLRKNMQTFVRKLTKKLNITTILVTHDKEEALIMADRIAVLVSGRIVQYDRPKEIYIRPKTKAVSDFFGDRNYLKGKIRNGVFSSSLGEISVDFDDLDNALMMIRPELINCSNKGYEGEVINSYYIGEIELIEVKVGDNILKISTLNNESITVGDVVHLEIDFSKVVIFKGEIC